MKYASNNVYFSKKMLLFSINYPTLNTLLAIRTEEAGYQAFYLK